MRHTIIPYLLSACALAAALAALLGPRAEPVAASSLVAQIGPAAALGGGFTYQGSLARGGQLVSGAGACAMRFSLWDAAAGGAQVGGAQTVGGVDFVQGLFTVTLNDAGQLGAAPFAGEARWLQVEAACPAGAALTSLGRQAIAAVPYASHSQSTAALQGRPLSAAAPAPGQLLAWDGGAWAPASAHARTVLVSPRATPAASGAALAEALAAISDASADRPYLLKIEPGVYDLGPAALQMKPYVDVEGSGQGVTSLTGAGGPSDAAAVVLGASNAELRQLTVRVSAADVASTTAIRNTGVSPRLTDVTVQVTAPTGANNRVFGIANVDGASPQLRRVTVHMRGGRELFGLYNLRDSSPTVNDSHLDVGAGYYGTTVYSETRSSPTLLATTIIGTDSTGYSFGVRSQDGSHARVYSSVINAVPPVGWLGFNDTSTNYVANSIVESRGSLNLGLGNKCVSSYNTQLVAVGASCQPGQP